MQYAAACTGFISIEGSNFIYLFPFPFNHFFLRIQCVHRIYFIRSRNFNFLFHSPSSLKRNQNSARLYHLYAPYAPTLLMPPTVCDNGEDFCLKKHSLIVYNILIVTLYVQSSIGKQKF